MRQQQQPPVSSRKQFCERLRSRRAAAQLSLDEIARVTRIPVISLERLEDGRFEELPGDVFVRGFLRSYARCVGLDADDTVRAYARCGLEPAPVSSELADEVLRQLEEVDRDATVSAPAPASPAAEPEPEPEAAPASTTAASTGAPSERPGRKRRRRRRRRHGSGRADERASTATPSGRASTATPPAQPERSADAEPAPAPEAAPESPSADAVDAAADAAAPRRQRTFLPPHFADEESSRRGPLTLAVIILVIVATLTMSYLLRRPSSPAEGFTEAPAERVPRLPA